MKKYTFEYSHKMIILGAALIVISTALSGIFVNRMQAKEALLKKQIQDLESKIDFSKKYVEKSERGRDSVDMYIHLFNETTQPELKFHYLEKAMNRSLTSIFDLNSAVSGTHPTESQYNQWTGIKAQGMRGSINEALQKFTDERDEYLSKWGKNNDDMVKLSNENKLELDAVSAKIRYAYFWAASFQILGLIVVLMKDLSNVKNETPSTKNLVDKMTTNSTSPVQTSAAGSPAPVRSDDTASAGG